MISPRRIIDAGWRETLGWVWEVLLGQLAAGIAWTVGKELVERAAQHFEPAIELSDASEIGPFADAIAEHLDWRAECACCDWTWSGVGSPHMASMHGRERGHTVRIHVSGSVTTGAPEEE